MRNAKMKELKKECLPSLGASETCYRPYRINVRDMAGKLTPATPPKDEDTTLPWSSDLWEIKNES